MDMPWRFTKVSFLGSQVYSIFLRVMKWIRKLLVCLVTIQLDIGLFLSEIMGLVFGDSGKFILLSIRL